MWKEEGLKKLISTKIWWETNTELKILWLCYQLNRIRDIPSVAVLWSEFRWFPSSISGSSNSSRQRFLSVWTKKKINQISHWKTNLRKWLANIGAIGLQKVAEVLEMIYWARVLEVGGVPIILMKVLRVKVGQLRQHPLYKNLYNFNL